MIDDEIRAREAIRYTLSVYTSAGDRGAMDELASAFTPDATLDIFGGSYAGRAQIVERLSTLMDPAATGPDLRPLGFMRHNLTSSRIEIDGPDAAHGWTYFVVLTPIGLDHCGVYVDRFARHGDRWLICHRRIKVDWTDVRSLVIPPWAENVGRQ